VTSRKQNAAEEKDHRGLRWQSSIESGIVEITPMLLVQAKARMFASLYLFLKTGFLFSIKALRASMWSSVSELTPMARVSNCS